MYNCGLKASMSNAHDIASVARDRAAPMKNAVTSFSTGEAFRMIAATTAHRLAPVNAVRRGVAFATFDPTETDRNVGLAERRRIFVVHKVGARWRSLV